MILSYFFKAILSVLFKWMIVSSMHEVIDESVQQLRDAELDLNVEEDVAGFLGISLEDQPSGSIQLMKKGLIDRILTMLNLVPGSHTKKTPEEYGDLTTMEMVMNVQKHGNYASVVGMLMYLSLSSCPDIMFAVNQCARFIHKPK